MYKRNAKEQSGRTLPPERSSTRDKDAQAACQTPLCHVWTSRPRVHQTDMVGSRRRPQSIQSNRKEANKQSHLNDRRETPTFRKRIERASGEEHEKGIGIESKALGRGAFNKKETCTACQTVNTAGWARGQPGGYLEYDQSEGEAAWKRDQKRRKIHVCAMASRNEDRIYKERSRS